MCIRDRLTSGCAWSSLVLDYCTAIRGVLNDDQGTMLDPPGVRMARALEQIEVSIDVCLDAKKGGLPIGRSAR